MKLYVVCYHILFHFLRQKLTELFPKKAMTLLFFVDQIDRIEISIIHYSVSFFRYEDHLNFIRREIVCSLLSYFILLSRTKINGIIPKKAKTLLFYQGCVNVSIACRLMYWRRRRRTTPPVFDISRQFKKQRIDKFI